MENLRDLMAISKDWNQDRLKKLKDLFPDLFTNEGKLNINEIKKVIDIKSVSETERYEFRWFGKSQSKRNAYTPSNATLVYDALRSINPVESENIIIEGENLEVLKLLSDSYREQIKCIYIDPPYNTGKDFVYSDNYTEDKKPYWEQIGVTENGIKIDTNTETEGRFHSNWLNMMYSRLLIARTMLKPEGVILISIDDNEVHHLRKLCDEVFGEYNFIGTFINNSTPNARDYGHIGKMHEFCMFYAKDILYTQTNLLEDKEKRFSFKDEIGEFNVHPLYNSNVAFTPENRPNLYYPFYLNPENQLIELGEEFYEISLIPNSDWIEIFPPQSVKDSVQFVWRWGREKSQEELNKEIVGYETEDGDFRIVQKMRTSEKLIRSILSEKEYSSRRGTAEVEKIFGKKVFSFPKPVELIKTFLKVATDENSLVLDFFAGAGTLGQAVMELNQEDGKERKFILVQIPEQTSPKSLSYKNGYKKISDITIERNKRVIQNIIQQNKNKLPDLYDNQASENPLRGLGFKVFKLTKSNFPRVEWAPDTNKTDEENILSLKKYIKEKESQLLTAFNQEELMLEILLKHGFKLNYNIQKQESFETNDVYLVKDDVKETLISLDLLIDEKTVEQLKTTNRKFICLESALNTTKKYNLKHYLGDRFKSF